MLFSMCGIALILMFAFVNRITLIFRMHRFAKRTQRPEWKAWRLSAVEPVITNILSLSWMESWLVGDPRLFYWLVSLNLILFAGLIHRAGERCQRGRLAITVIITRLFLILLSALSALTNITWEGIGSFWLVAAAFALQLIFGIYQGFTTSPRRIRIPGSQQSNSFAPIVDEGVLNDVTLIEDPELWNAQIALIEQLKAEEEEERTENAL